jgi:hypothetical protein
LACLWLCNLAKDKRTPYQLPEISTLRASFSAAGLGPFLNDLREASVAPEQWVVPVRVLNTAARIFPLNETVRTAVRDHANRSAVRLLIFSPAAAIQNQPIYLLAT